MVKSEIQTLMRRRIWRIITKDYLTEGGTVTAPHGIEMARVNERQEVGVGSDSILVQAVRRGEVLRKSTCMRTS